MIKIKGFKATTIDEWWKYREGYDHNYEDVNMMLETAKRILTELNDTQPCPTNYKALEGLSYALKWMNYRKTYIENDGIVKTVED